MPCTVTAEEIEFMKPDGVFLSNGPGDPQDAKPVIEYMPGWKVDISGIRTWEELPKEARDYVEYIEKEIGCHIKYVSVGAERDAYILR